MAEYVSHVRFVGGNAEVKVGDRSFTVAGRNADGSPYTCPVELVVGALGS